MWVVGLGRRSVRRCSVRSDGAGRIALLPTRLPERRDVLVDGHGERRLARPGHFRDDGPRGTVERQLRLRLHQGRPASSIIHTHTHPFNGPFSGTTQMSRYQKGKTNMDFTEARDSEWQWHQLGHMQVCTLLQTDNHTSTPPFCYYRPDALPAAQPTSSKH